MAKHRDATRDIVLIEDGSSDMTRPAPQRHNHGERSYETRLSSDLRWALNESSKHFEKKSLVFKSLYKIAKRLDDLGISYVVVGGMALFQHGFRRYTEDVDLLVSKEDLSLIHSKLEGLGYLPPFTQSKQLRDTETGVRIEFLVAGEYPGDGKAKPVIFGGHGNDIVEADGVNYIGLASLLDLKLASGMSNANRLKDLADVQELLKVVPLPDDFAGKLNPYVRDKFIEFQRGIKDEELRHGFETFS